MSALDTYGNVATGFTGPRPSTSPIRRTALTEPSPPSGFGGLRGGELVKPSKSRWLTPRRRRFQRSQGADQRYLDELCRWFGAGRATTPSPFRPQRSGMPFGVTITAIDQFANVATGYSGTAGLVPTAGGISPRRRGLAGRDGRVRRRRWTLRQQTITATDAQLTWR